MTFCGQKFNATETDDHARGTSHVTAANLPSGGKLAGDEGCVSKGEHGEYVNTDAIGSIPSTKVSASVSRAANTLGDGLQDRRYIHCYLRVRTDTKASQRRSKRKALPYDGKPQRDTIALQAMSA